jgi:murein DD-endopeptidase MepM/ murein hydrolase activator NlpD
VTDRIAILAVAALLAGCVPAGFPQIVDAGPAPRIEPMMDLLLDEPPIWDSRPAVANSRVAADGRRRHRVVASDTGIAIARAYGIPWRAIVEANSLADPFIIRPGQMLVLPGAGSPSVEARAAAFKIDIDDIATGGTPARVSSDPLPTTDGFGGQFRSPVRGSIAERFGRLAPGYVNRGIELSTAPGADVRAAAGGTVAFVGNGGSAGYGGLILIRHGARWISVYGRAAEATVVRGQSVAAGQIIGRVGAEGRLHFELRKDRIPVDPSAHLR